MSTPTTGRSDGPGRSNRGGGGGGRKSRGGGRGGPRGGRGGKKPSAAKKSDADVKKDNKQPPSSSAVASVTAKTTTTTTEQDIAAAKANAEAEARAAEEQKKREELENQKLEERKKDLAARSAKLHAAIEVLKSSQSTFLLHAKSRAQFETEHLKMARAEFEKTKKNLKADLKKCTTFVKKVKSGTIYSSKPDDITNDVATLNLSRYVEEVVAAILESKPKVTELAALTALCQAMHERYPEFLPNLLPNLWNVVLGNNSSSSKTKVNLAELSKSRRLYVRLLADFLVHGMLSTNDTNKLVKCVTEWTGNASNNYHVTDAVAVTAFCRASGLEILGIVSTTIREAMEIIDAENTRFQKTESTDSFQALLPPELLDNALECVGQIQPILKNQRALPVESVQMLSQHCLGAYQTLAASLVQTHRKLQKVEKRCEQDRLLSGQLTENREKGLVDARKLTDSLLKTIEALSECLDQPIPILEDEEDEEIAGKSGVEVWTKDALGHEQYLGPFDDEETRAFYCDIPDFLTTIPPALLGISEGEIEKRKAENIKKYGEHIEEPTVVESAADMLPVSEEQFEATEEENYANLSGDEDGNAKECDEENKETPHYRLMTLLEQELPECNRREQIDELSEKFCTNHGSSKNSRKRLTKTLFMVPRSRLDLLPYYSRMAATVDRVWRDITPKLIGDLEQQFHGQAKFKKNQNLDSRMRTARYIGELTKFRVAPPIVSLRCLYRCIEDFTGSNVDVACCMLETCGRFLYRTKHTNSRITEILESMARLSKAKNLDERLQSLIQSAFYCVKPPASGPRKTAKEYPPLEAYLRYLLLVRLEPNDVSISAVSKQLVRLPWDDQSHQCGALVCRIMLKACRRGRYKTIEAVAAVASKLRTQRAAGEVTIRVLDAVLDELRGTLEYPSFRDQQRMITYTRLLGELYCKSQVSGQVIIQQLHSFINVGHEIPESLREACKKWAKDTEEQDGMLPVYNSAGGVSQTIQEDEEMAEPDLVTKEETQSVQIPVAVSEHSKCDPRVPSLKDPPNSSYRITLVCAMLDVVAKSLVSKNNLPKLRVFFAAFQRYLFTKTFLPTDVEFAMLDCFDLVDSQWKRVCGRSGSGSEKQADSENGFPRYNTWIDAHNATVAFEESEAAFELQKQAKLEVLADETKSVADFSDGISMNEEDMGSIMDEDEEDASVSLHSLESGVSIEEHEHVDMSVDQDTAGGEDLNTSDEDGDELEDSDDDDDDSDESEGESDSEDDEEEEFDEVAYMRQLEEEAFERELRRMTMDALEKGKSASRKHVGDSMITGSQIIKKKPNEALKSVDAGAPPGTGFALGGEAGISFQVLKKGAKGKVEARELVVPKDTKLAQVATRQDDEKARERDVIKQRVLKYEEQSAEAEFSGGNVYLEQERLQINRNKTLSMEEIDKNFGTTGGNLLPDQVKKRPVSAGRSVAGRGGRTTTGRGRGGRSSSSGRGLFGL